MTVTCPAVVIAAKSIVIPAKAGTQWIAGMTKGSWSLVPVRVLKDRARCPQRDRDQPQHARRCNADRGGATFRLWAPEARQVFVLTGAALRAAEQAGFVPSPDDAMVRIGDGSWGAFVADLDEGAAYRFWIVGSGSTGFKRDPRARELSVVPAYPECDCLVHDPASYPWHDGGFRAPEFRDLILYQLHIGAYYAVDAQGHDKRGGVAKFLDLLDRVDYLRDLGINGVQFLPIQEFPSQTSRGYNGLDLYSPEMDYHVADDGELNRYLWKANALLARANQPPLTLDQLRPGPNQLRCVIDILHLNGIAVLFDLVFNHAGPGFNDQSIKFLDRQPYGDDNRSLYFTDQSWVGGNVFAYWNQDVRQFLIDNAVQCLDEFHIDGIRYDEVTVIDRNGGGRFCQDVTSTARFTKPAGDPDRRVLGGRPRGGGACGAWRARLRRRLGRPAARRHPRRDRTDGGRARCAGRYRRPGRGIRYAGRVRRGVARRQLHREP